MDKGRRIKFIKQFDENLQRILQEEKNTVITRELENFFYELSENELIENNDTEERLLSHNPKQTIEFLRQFKYNDGSGFKELIHDTNLVTFTPRDILEKVKSHPNFISHAKEERVKGFIPIHKFVQLAMIELINSFEKKGLPFYYKTKKHPYGHDQEYTNLALKFKRNYRFGSGREYTTFSDNLINLSKQDKYKNHFLSDHIYFLPDKRKFNIRANFFSWVDSINFGLKYFLDGIKDHGNIQGSETYNLNQKVIEVECEKSPSMKRVRITILDKQSLAKKDPQKLLKYFRESNAFKIYYRSLCDWIVEADIDGEKPVRINVLSDNNQNDIQILNTPIGGFKYILEFYDF